MVTASIQGVDDGLVFYTRILTAVYNALTVGKRLDYQSLSEISSKNVVLRPHLLTQSDMILQPSTEGKVDPAVLASLPASMQLDLLVQVRLVNIDLYGLHSIPHLIINYFITL